MSFKKIFAAGIFSVFFLLSSMAFGAPSLANLHSAKNQLPASTTTDTRSLKAVKGFFYETQISIVNNSSQTIYVAIPGSAYARDCLWPGEVGYYYSDDYFDFIKMTLFDSFGFVFFNDYVPNYSTIYVDNGFFYAQAGDKAEKKSHLRAVISKVK